MYAVFHCVVVESRVLTSFTCSGHVVPEAAKGGPIGLVKDGDTISIDAEANTLEFDVSEEELERRRKDWTPPTPKVKQGGLLKYTRLVADASHGAVTDLWTEP